MFSAEKIATRLAYEFLRTGRYSASSGPVEIQGPGIAATGIEDAQISAYASQTEGFSGLAVQSVGFEEGSEDPVVHIYLTRGAVKQMKSLPQEIDGVTVKVHRMGPITVRPEPVASSTDRGNIFELGDRICCGSSCGPTSERGAGTFGAIVRIGAGRQIYLLSNNHVLSGCNHVPHNQPVLAPASMDGRPDAVAPHEIGRHHMLHELHSGDPHFVVPGGIDLALALVGNPDAVSSWQGDRDNGYDTPSQISEPFSLQRVELFGFKIFGPFAQATNTSFFPVILEVWSWRRWRCVRRKSERRLWMDYSNASRRSSFRWAEPRQWPRSLI